MVRAVWMAGILHRRGRNTFSQDLRALGAGGDGAGVGAGAGAEP